jgi:hypothetical protein
MSSLADGGRIPPVGAEKNKQKQEEKNQAEQKKVQIATCFSNVEN